MATSVTRHGITWTFDTDYTVGTYANGDYYVVENTASAGVIISSITTTVTPQGTARSGTVVNPSRGTTQGFDDRISNRNVYSDELDISNNLPFTVSASSSVVTADSTTATQSFEQINTFAVLTVLASAPASNSFRPSYIGGNYSHPWAKSDLDYTKLADMDKTAITVPSISNSESNFEKVWYEQDLNWTGRYLHTDYMGGQNGYGKSMAIYTGTAALQLNLDYSDAEKETLLVSFVQYGIDIHGIIEDGGTWYADGGHNPGRLIPLFIAAMTLDDANMKANVNANNGLNFQEQQQTFYVSQSDIDLPRYTADGRPRTPYSSEDIGKPEWGIRHSSLPSKDGDNWDAYYRDIGGGVLPAPAIVIYLMSGGSVLNWPALTDYAKRHIYYRQSRYTNPIYYNGYDDGDAYGEGNTNKSAPFSSNETNSFHTNFYLEFEDAPPVGSSPDVTPPVISGVSVASKTDTTATIEWTTDEGATSNVDWDVDSGTPYANTETNPGLQKSHSITITGLTANTLYYYRVRSSDASGNESIETEASFTTNVVPTITVTPTFSPAGANYWDSQTVTITASPSDSIEYTTDGTDPDGDDNTYSVPFSVDQANGSTRIKAIASKAAQTDSAVGVADYGFSPWVTIDSGWINVVYPTKTTAFTEDVYASAPINESCDLVVGFGLTADNYNDSAILFRFAISGLIEARNGSLYSAENNVYWTQGEVYKFSLSNVVFGTSYDLSVTDSSERTTVIASGYSWRTDWTGSDTINNLAFYDSVAPGGLVSRNNDISQFDPPPPVRKINTQRGVALY